MIIKIEKDSEDFKNYYWLLTQPKPKNDQRWHIKYVMVKDGKMVSTNGSWLGEIDTELEDGFYEVVRAIKSLIQLVKVTDLDGGSFPDYEDIFDEKGMEDIGQIFSESLDYGFSQVLEPMIESGNTFNIKLFMSLLDPKKGLYFEGMLDREGNRPLLLKDGSCRAALMPVRK